VLGGMERLDIRHSFAIRMHQSVMCGKATREHATFGSGPESLLEVWRAGKAAGEELCLATLVRTTGSSYRKTGAKIIVSASGRRAGMVSGGCLEAEVCRKIWWLTESGPSLQRYATSPEFLDNKRSGGAALGCGGELDILFERGAGVDAAMEALCASVEQRLPSVIVRVVESADASIPVGTVSVFSGAGHFLSFGGLSSQLERTLRKFSAEVFAYRESRNATVKSGSDSVQVFGEYVAPPFALIVFGAGDDAKPVVEMSRSLGWDVTVADARGHLVTQERFPSAKDHIALEVHEPAKNLCLSRYDAAVVMTHSVEQDRALLPALMAAPLRYLGLLGARHRTRKLVGEVADALQMDYTECLGRLYAPIGLHLGAETPEAIALSIVAEVQLVLSGSAGQLARRVRRITQCSLSYSTEQIPPMPVHA
jgi:xanthine dehydrogenase accessory factor